MPELLTFRKFNDIALAQNLVDLLVDNDIEYLLEESPVLFNPTFATRTEASTEYSVKISSTDFTRANQILADYESEFTDDVEPDYYLLSFTNDELMEVLAKPDEWSAFDVVLAKKLLKGKGVIIDETVERQLNEQRLTDLKKPEKSDSAWVNFGYFFAVFGGILGFFIGWQLWTSKKHSPTANGFTPIPTATGKAVNKSFTYLLAG